MLLAFLGDTHDTRPDLCSLEVPTYQVGDFGTGFAQHQDYSHSLRFIRGNHDDPGLCRKHPNYLGDFGYVADHDLYFVSGAASRFPGKIHGLDWWQDEELSIPQGTQALELYIKTRPRIVISHDAPVSWIPQLVARGHKHDRTRTQQLLQHMWEAHRPQLWVFGHHHRRFNSRQGRTVIQGLAIRDLLTVDVTPKKIGISSLVEVPVRVPQEQEVSLG